MNRLSHAAKLLATFNVGELYRRPFRDFGLITRRPVASIALGAIGVVVSRVRFDQTVEMVAAKKNEVLQAFLLDTLDCPLDSRIQFGDRTGELCSRCSITTKTSKSTKVKSLAARSVTTETPLRRVVFLATTVSSRERSSLPLVTVSRR